MTRYIDQKDVYDLLGPTGVAKVHCTQIDDLPRADVVEVVRCKDCGFCDETMRCQCDNSCKGLIREDNDFCSYGIAKE